MDILVALYTQIVYMAGSSDLYSTVFYNEEKLYTESFLSNNWLCKHDPNIQLVFMRDKSLLYPDA